MLREITVGIYSLNVSLALYDIKRKRFQIDTKLQCFCSENLSHRFSLDNDRKKIKIIQICMFISLHIN